MSRTDKDRPYEVRAADRLTKNRYWSDGWIMSHWVTEPRWEVDEYHVKRPQRFYRRDRWGAVRVAQQQWKSLVLKGDVDREPSEGGHRHGLLWDWE